MIQTNNEQLTYQQFRCYYQNKEICSATISPDENYLVFGGYSKVLNIIDLVQDKLVSSIQYLEYISVCLFSKDQEFLYIGDHKGQLFCYDKNFKLYFQEQIHKQQIRNIALKQNTQPITCSYDRSIKITDIQLNIVILTIDMAHTDSIKALHYENNTMVSGGRDCTINVYNTDSGKIIIQKLNAHSYCVFQVQMIQQKTKLISLCEGCNLKIWKLDLDQQNCGLFLIKQLTDINNIQNCYGLDDQILLICNGYVKLLDQDLNVKQTIQHEISYFQSFDVKQLNSLNYIILLGQKQIILFKKVH